MDKIHNGVLTFAGSLQNYNDVYESFKDYFWNYKANNLKKGEKVKHEYQTTYTNKLGETRELSFAQKESAMNDTLKREIMRVAGFGKEFDITGLSLESLSNNPQLRWATYAVVSNLIDLIMPITLIDSIGMYSDVITIGYGDSASFNITPRDLFVVSKAGKAKRTSPIQKQFNGQVNLIPELRELTVGVSLYRVLAGLDSLAFLVAKATESIESQVTVDAYNAFATAMASIDNTASTGLRVAGYTQPEFVRLSQTVRAWNGGANPIAIGTQAALANILPADANYRYDLESDYVKMGYIRNFQQTDILQLPQVADWTTPFALKLADNRVWIISPSVNKLIKVVLGGATIAYTDDVYRNANLEQNSVIQKAWATGVATNAVGATIELS